jgi:hypothetical protein
MGKVRDQFIEFNFIFQRILKFTYLSQQLIQDITFRLTCNNFKSVLELAVEIFYTTGSPIEDY